MVLGAGVLSNEKESAQSSNTATKKRLYAARLPSHVRKSATERLSNSLVMVKACSLSHVADSQSIIENSMASIIDILKPDDSCTAEGEIRSFRVIQIRTFQNMLEFGVTSEQMG